MTALIKWCNGSVSRHIIAVLGLTVIDLPLFLLSLLPIASPELWGIALWFAYILAFALALCAVYEFIDKSAMKRFDLDQ